MFVQQGTHIQDVAFGIDYLSLILVLVGGRAVRENAVKVRIHFGIAVNSSQRADAAMQRTLVNCIDSG